MTNVPRILTNVLTSFVPVSPANRVWVFCDPAREWLADGFVGAARKLGATAARIGLELPGESAGASGRVAAARAPDRSGVSRLFDPGPVAALLSSLGADDLVVACFSHDFAVASGIGRVFPAFQGPVGYRGRSVVVRQRIPDDALLAMLAENVGEVNEQAEAILAIGREAKEAAARAAERAWLDPATAGEVAAAEPAAAPSLTPRTTPPLDGATGRRGGRAAGRGAKGGLAPAEAPPPPPARLRVTTRAGTDVTFETSDFRLAPYLADSASPDRRHAYLPAAEIYAAVIPGSAEGIIRIDATVGEFVHEGCVVDPFGLVEAPIDLVVRDGMVVEVNRKDRVGGVIAVPEAEGEERGRGGRRRAGSRVGSRARSGSRALVTGSDPAGITPAPVAAYGTADPSGTADMADRLRHLLAVFPEACRVVAEFGVGLSAGKPTGHIGVDECLRGTCHFGLGDNTFYGGTNQAPVHLDVVLKAPTIEVGS